MLSRLLTRIPFNKWYSLKAPNYLTEASVEMLKSRMQTTPNLSQQLQNLDSLNQQGQLAKYYKGRQLHALSDCELFYLMNSQVPFNLTRGGQKEVVLQVESVFFKCLLFRQFGWSDHTVQYHITLSFNEALQNQELTPEEIVFCLDAISYFKAGGEVLQLSKLQAALDKFDKDLNYPHEMILIYGYVAGMGLDIRALLNAEQLKLWVQRNPKWNLRTICFVYRLAEVLGLKISKALKNQLNQFLPKAFKESSGDSLEADYQIWILKYYPSLAEKITVSYLSPEAYFQYLKFLKEHPQVPMKNKQVPLSVLERTNSTFFRLILDLRIELNLDSIPSLGKQIADFFVFNLKPVTCYLNMLLDLKVKDAEIAYQVEQTILKKIEMHEFKVEMAEVYGLRSIIAMLNLLNRTKLLSVDFWRTAVKWIEQMLAHHQQIPFEEINGDVFLNLFEISLSKNFKQPVKQYLAGKVIEALQKEKWSLKQLGQLTKMLGRNRIGEPQMWLLLQARLKVFSNNAESPYDQFFEKRKRSIVIYFALMSKGSYDFWTSMDLTLSNDSKRYILQTLKIPGTHAHTYLKVPLSS